MNFKMIFNIIGFLLILTGLAMLTGIPFSIYYNDNDVLALIIAASIQIGIGSILFYFTRTNDAIEIKKKDGFLIVSIGWFLISVFGALPFVIHGSIPTYTDAFFETISGFTTTGASILSDIEKLPYGLLYWRCLTQWLGGMGIIVLSLAILPILGVGGMQLFTAEVAGVTKDKIHPRVKETAKRLWAIYILLTGIQTALLMIGNMSFFDALCHSFTTLATGGFSTKNASIAHFESIYIHYIIIIFMFLAGTNFTLHYFALKGRIRTYFENEEFRFYLIVIVITVLFAFLYIYLTGIYSFEESFRNSAFNIISILSSTGFANADYESWAPFFTFFFFLLLLFGASSGSTSGGIKMVRHLILLKNIFSETKRLLHPQAIFPIRYNLKPISQEITIKITAFVLLYFITIGIGGLIMTFTGLDFISAIGSVAACLGNIGPGLGTTGPVNNYSELTISGKWFLSLIMLLGRLEFYTILILFTPAFWKN